MLSALLNRAHNSQDQQPPRASAFAPQQYWPRSYPTESHTLQTAQAMAASAATAHPVDVTMQNHDENRTDLPRPYKCPLCEKAFHRLEHQTRHIRTHTGEKPHACQFPGCSKRFSRSDELTRHSRIHNNPNSRRGNKQNVAAVQAAAAAIQGGMYEGASYQQVPVMNQRSYMTGSSPPSQQSHGYPMPSMQQMHSPSPVHQPRQLPLAPPPPMSQATQSAPSSQLNSPNVSPPNSYATYSSNPGSYITRNASGDISPAQNGYHRPMDINMLATAASQVEREHNNAPQIPSSHLSFQTTQNYYHNAPYHVGRMPSLSSYHYSSNPGSQPMSRSQSDDEHYGQRGAKPSKPPTPHSTAPPSPEFPHESTSPTPDHTPLATPSHSPRLRPQFFHNGVQLPTLHHLTIQNHPPPALAPVEPAADGHQPYVPMQHSGLRISEIMEAGDGAKRKLPVPMVAAKDGGFAKINELVNPDSGRSSEAGNDDQDRM